MKMESKCEIPLFPKEIIMRCVDNKMQLGQKDYRIYKVNEYNDYYIDDVFTIEVFEDASNESIKNILELFSEFDIKIGIITDVSVRSFFQNSRIKDLVLNYRILKNVDPDEIIENIMKGEKYIILKGPYYYILKKADDTM